MYTGKAYDLGRGTRSDPVEGLVQWTPGPGRYENDTDFKPTIDYMPPRETENLKGFS